MYLRFVLDHPHPDTGVLTGIMQTAYRLRDEGPLTDDDRKILTDEIRWFELNLAVPRRFNRTTSKGFYRRQTKGVAWFKATAKEHVQRMRRIARVLEDAGYPVLTTTTARPGYITHEDEYQVIAEPFREHRSRESV